MNFDTQQKVKQKVMKSIYLQVKIKNPMQFSIFTFKAILKLYQMQADSD